MERCWARCATAIRSPGDHDFDLLIRPEQLPEILALNEELAAEKIFFARTIHPGGQLAINPGGIESFSTCAIGVHLDSIKIGDLYAFHLFRDGVLRRFDPDSGAYWCPHSSFPHYFVEQLEMASLRGRRYPIPRDAGKLLEGIYGADWRTPYRAKLQGGEGREGTTTHGDRYLPKLREELAWCERRGWDRAAYGASARGRS